MKRIIRYIFRLIIYVVSVLLFILCLFISVALIKEYKPSNEEIICQDCNAPIMLNDTLKIISWNIGYCGLGDDMDFFYDGGKTMRTSHERIMINIKGVLDLLKKHNDADIIMLQEVDIESFRSYGVNQLELFKEGLPGYHVYFAYNYNSFFVPVPINNPMRGVKSGLVIFIKEKPALVTRVQYPGSFSMLERPFNLKRCGLVAEINIRDNMTLTVINSHNSAFDDGNMRYAELKFLDSLLLQKSYAIVAGDWNSTPPGYLQSEDEKSNKYFQPIELKTSLFSRDYKFICDTLIQSARYGYEPYIEGETTETLIDFALVTKNIDLITVDCLDEKFRFSDHNPVIYKLVVSDGNCGKEGNSQRINL